MPAGVVACRVVITPGSSTVLTGFWSAAAAAGLGAFCAWEGAVPTKHNQAATPRRINLLPIVMRIDR